MVLESLLSPIRAEKDPKRMLLWGFICVLVAGLLGFVVFEAYASMVLVFLAALAVTPFMYNIIKYEEEKDLQDMPERLLLEEHWKALKAFMYMFYGMTLGVVVLYVFLPDNTVATLFKAQIDTLISIRGGTGMVVFASQVNSFSIIFFNNLKVLIFSILFSFVFGAGAIFILTWNATVLGVAIGSFIRGNLALISDLVGFEKVANYFQIFSIGLLKYLIHGIPEILAYFVGALAGGIISVAIIRHDFDSAKFEHIVLDSADLLFISIGLLFVAAILEVWITPIFF